MLVDHASERIAFWAREADAWRSSAFGSGETVPLSAIGCSLPVDVIYAAARSA